MEQTYVIADREGGRAATPPSDYHAKALEMETLALNALDAGAREQFLLLALRYERLAQGIG